MDIDLDWCLTCQRHFDGQTPYCSPECQERAGPSTSRPKHQVFCTCNHDDEYDDEDEDYSSFNDDVIFHEIEVPTGSSRARWLGNDYAGIAAWAAEIPTGIPEDELSSQPPNKSRPPPNLLKSSHRIVPPSLCMTSSQPEPPSTTSTPILTPSINPFAQTSSRQASLANASEKSAQTDSSLSTPASSNPVPILFAGRKSSAFDEMYTQVRSWVSPCPAIFIPPQQKHFVVDYARGRKSSRVAA